MQDLNLPSYEHKLKEIDGKTCIFDSIRKKYLVLTPEEWVRQHFINLLVNRFNYPKGRVSVEKGVDYQKNVKKRTDILIYDENGNVDVLVELKAPHIKLGENVFLQLAAYNKVHNARLMMISNGIQTFCFEVGTDNRINFLDELPVFERDEEN